MVTTRNKGKNTNVASSARRKKKPAGDASTPLPCPASSTPTIHAQMERSAQVEPSQQQPSDPGLTPSTSPLPPIGHNAYIWDALAVGPPPNSVPAFPFINPLPTYPTFAPTVPAHSLHAANLSNGTTSPVACHVTSLTSELSQRLPNTTRSPSPQSRSQSPSTGSETGGTPSRPKTSTRNRVSRRNPFHGTVEGAMVGNEVYNVPRARELPKTMTNISAAAKRFKRLTDDLVCRAECLSHETDCWLTLCAQRSGSGSTYHYTSPRLRREALDEASGMVSTFQKATFALNVAKRQEAKQIAENYEKQLAEGLAREKAAEKEVNQSRQRERDLLAELESEKAAVKAYRDQLASGINATVRTESTM